MDPRMIDMDDLDLEISIAYIALSGARAVWTRCPVAETRQRIDEARAEVDLLLAGRLVAQASREPALLGAGPSIPSP